MPAKTAYERKSKYRTNEYRGERGVGGNLVYAGDHALDKHLFVHHVAPGGFDWGPDADVERACQLAIALVAPWKGVDAAVEHYHTFAGNVVLRDLTGDAWTLSRKDLRNPTNYQQFMDRDYPENTAPGPDEVPALEAVDLDAITYAEEIALARKYEAVLWTRGNRRENLGRLRAIWDGSVDPAEDRVQSGHLYHLMGDVPSNARQVLVKKFETMGELAGWVWYGRSHSRMDGISEAAARAIRDARPEFVRYFGGEDYIPEYDDGYLTLDDPAMGNDQQQTLVEPSSETDEDTSRDEGPANPSSSAASEPRTS